MPKFNARQLITGRWGDARQKYERGALWWRGICTTGCLRVPAAALQRDRRGTKPGRQVPRIVVIARMASGAG